MTIKEYMIQNHPDQIDPECLGGVTDCPNNYEDLNHLDLRKCDGTFSCEYCWDQPYTPPNNIEETHSPEPAKTYEDGLNEAWKLQQKLSALTYQQLENAGMPISWRNYSYNEAKSKYDSYTEELIKIGDEITNGISTGYVLYVDNESNLMCVKLDSYSYPQELDIGDPRFHKTGKHNSKLAEVISEITEDPQ